MQRIRDVDFLVDTLLKKFQAHPGNDGKTPEMEAVFGKDRAVPSFTGVEIPKHAVFCVRRLTTFIATVLQCMIKIDTAGNGRDVAEQIVVVAYPRIETLCVVGPQLN